MDNQLATAATKEKGLYRQGLGLVLWLDGDGTGAPARALFPLVSWAGQQGWPVAGGTGAGELLKERGNLCTRLDDLASTARSYIAAGMPVLALTDRREVLIVFSAMEGAIPVLLCAEPSPLLEAANHLEIADASALGPLCGASAALPRYILRLFLEGPEIWRFPIVERNTRFGEQARRRNGVWIFGAGTIGRQVQSACAPIGLPVHGFVDNDPSKQGQRLNDLPIVAPDWLDPHQDSVILASGNYSSEIAAQLETLGFCYVQNLSEFFFAACSPGQPEKEFADDLRRRRISYMGLYLSLGDALSRECLNAIIGYRQSFDLRILATLRQKGMPQWFDPAFFTPNPHHVFVDGGAFDGDTALTFIQRNGGPSQAIHLFELDSELAARAAMNLQVHPTVSVHRCGLSDRPGTVHFCKTGMTDGRLGEAAGTQVRVDTVDNVVAEPITFLKLDVEGEEARALVGASHHIRADAPLLAVAAYHNVGDIWALPRLIARINPAYTFYLRHYTQTTYETVVYGVPHAR